MAMKKWLRKKFHEQQNDNISELKFHLIFSVPISIVILFFPYKDPVFLHNNYPFTISHSGSDVNFRVGFSEVPQIIPAYTIPPILSSIGIPKDLFSYQQCFFHRSYVIINNKKKYSDTINLDVRVKAQSQTHHLDPNTSLCLPSEETFSEIFVGDVASDGDRAVELLKQNDDLPVEGMSEVIIKDVPIYSKILMFIAITFSFCSIYWAGIIALHTVTKFIYKEKSGR